jgi:hypothetical protein
MQGRKRIAYKIWAWALLLGALLGGSPRVGAQACVGDCGGHGAVGINDLILAVNIALGQASPDACPALGPAPISIAQLIASVNSALCGCGACPTPPPAPSASKTPRPTTTPTSTSPPTDSPTPSATPTPTQVISYWREDQYKLVSSGCPKDVNDIIRSHIPDSPDIVTVWETGDASQISFASSGGVGPAQIDSKHVLRGQSVDSATQEGCTVTETDNLQVDLSAAHPTATYNSKVHASNCARALDCSFKVTARWTRISQPTASTGSGTTIFIGSDFSSSTYAGAGGLVSTWYSGTTGPIHDPGWHATPTTRPTRTWWSAPVLDAALEDAQRSVQ